MRHRYHAICYLMLLVCGACTAPPADPDDRAIPEIRLDTFSRDRFSLKARQGKIVVLVFWATYCRWCSEALATANALNASQEDNGVVIAGVCTDPENRLAVGKKIAELKLDYPVLLDRGGRVYKRLGLRGVPSTLVINPRGEVVLRRMGFNPAIKEEIEARIKILKDQIGTP